jgi:hypothetical protein
MGLNYGGGGVYNADNGDPKTEGWITSSLLP